MRHVSHMLPFSVAAAFIPAGLSFVSSSLEAQVTTATVYGVVQDSTSATVAGPWSQ